MNKLITIEYSCDGVDVTISFKVSEELMEQMNPEDTFWYLMAEGNHKIIRSVKVEEVYDGQKM